MLFAPGPLAEYAFRDDGTRVYPHNDDARLYRVLNDVGNCVHGLRKLAGAFRVALTTVGVTIEQADGYLKQVMGDYVKSSRETVHETDRELCTGYCLIFSADRLLADN